MPSVAKSPALRKVGGFFGPVPSKRRAGKGANPTLATIHQKKSVISNPPYGLRTPNVFSANCG